MTNLRAIAGYYKTIKGSHSYSMPPNAGLIILWSSVQIWPGPPYGALCFQWLRGYL